MEMKSPCPLLPLLLSMYRLSKNFPDGDVVLIIAKWQWFGCVWGRG